MECPLTVSHLASPINRGITARYNFACSHCLSRLDRSPGRCGDEACACLGGCAGRAFAVYGSYDPPDPRCGGATPGV